MAVSKDTVTHPRLLNTRAVWGSMLELQQLRGTRAPQCIKAMRQPAKRTRAVCGGSASNQSCRCVALSTSARQRAERTHFEGQQQQILLKPRVARDAGGHDSLPLRASADTNSRKQPRLTLTSWLRIEGRPQPASAAERRGQACESLRRLVQSARARPPFDSLRWLRVRMCYDASGLCSRRSCNACGAALELEISV